MDITTPRMDGLEAIQMIKSSHPNIAVLVLTIHSDDHHIIEILRAGAAGYLTKSVFGEEVVQSVRGVVAGEMVLSQLVGERLLKQAARYPAKTVLLPAGLLATCIFPLVYRQYRAYLPYPNRSISLNLRALHFLLLLPPHHT